MSVQPLSIASPSVDPAPVRRRAAEPDSGREAEPFTLPEEPRREAAAPVEEAPAPRAKSEPAPAEEQSPQPAAKPKPAAAAPEAAKPAEAEVAAPPAAAVTPVKLDVGALVSIAVAAQAETPLEGKPGTDKDAKDKAVGETPVLDPSALLAPPPVLAADGTAAPAPLPQSLDLSAAIVPAAVVVVAPAATEAAALASEAAVTTTPGAVLAAGVAQAGPAAPKAAAAASSQADTAGDADPNAAAASGGEGDAPLVAAGEQPAVHAVKTGKEEQLAPSTNSASPQAEFKPLELLQAPQSPIDLSLVAQSRGGKAGAVTELAAPEQMAAGQPLTAQGQGAASGPPTSLHMVPIEIGMKAMAGVRKFDIRLDPAELGRVDVNLEISDKGEVSARLVVDRVETLHMLQRDARTLERAFEQAGLKPSDAGVDITLRDPADQSGFRQNRQQDEAPRRSPTASETGDDVAVPAQPAAVRRLVRLGGVDLSI